MSLKPNSLISLFTYYYIKNAKFNAPFKKLHNQNYHTDK